MKRVGRAWVFFASVLCLGMVSSIAWADSSTIPPAKTQPASPTRGLPPTVFKVVPGSKNQLHQKEFETVIHRSEYGAFLIRGQGEVTHLEILVNEPTPRFSLESGYRYARIHRSLLGVRHVLTAGATLTKGSFSLALAFAFGSQVNHYPSWRCRQTELGLRALAGYGIDFNFSRLGMELGGELTTFEVKYASGVSRQPIGGWLGASLVLLVPCLGKNPIFMFQARFGMGLRISEGVVVSDQKPYITAQPFVEIGLRVPL